MHRTILVLLAILLLATFLRFYKLGMVPVGLHRDEAFLGYNAYSLLKTGKDMSGNFLPLHLASFLYSPAGYSYASIPFIAILGLNAFSVRFTSALFGSLTVISMYFLTKELFKNHLTSHISLLTSFFLAISPWHINMSRTATENVLVVFLLVTATYVFLVWLTKQQKTWVLVICALLYSLTLFIYQAPRAFLPLFLPILFFIFRKEIKKRFFPIFLFIMAIIVPVAIILRTPNLSLRVRTVSIASTAETQLVLDEQIREDGTRTVIPMVSRLFHNKFLAYTDQFLQNYFAHLSYAFLFTDKGLPERYRVPGFGLLYLFELPLVLVGLFQLAKTWGKVGQLIIAWFLVTFVGSALTFDDIPNLQRTLSAVPPIAFLSAVGLTELVTWGKRLKRFARVASVSLVMVLLFNIALYLHQYYIHQIVHRPWSRQEGYEELVSKVNRLLPRYQKAIITNRESGPTVFFLFYNQYNPVTFQKESKGITDQTIDRTNFAKFEFSLDNCPARADEIINEVTGDTSLTYTAKSGVLYVNWGECKLYPRLKLLADIKRSDSTAVFRIVELTQ